MPLDLTYARTLAEQGMIDACVVTRDTQGTTDDAVDPTTLELIPPGSDSSTVYEGKCLKGKATQRVDTSAEGGQNVYRRMHRIRFPVSAARFRAGDIVTMTASDNAESNAQLVDQKFRIFDPDERSLVSSRIVLAEDITGARPR